MPVADPTNQVRQAVDTAIAAAWDFFARSSGQGLAWADIDGCRTVADYRGKLAADPAGLVGTCQMLLDYDLGLEESEREAFRTVIGIAETLALRGSPAPTLQPAPPAAPIVPAPPTEPAPLPEEPAPRSAKPRQKAGWFVLGAATLAALGFVLLPRTPANPPPSKLAPPQITTAPPIAPHAAPPAAPRATPTPAPTASLSVKRAEMPAEPRPAPSLVPAAPTPKPKPAATPPAAKPEVTPSPAPQASAPAAEPAPPPAN